MRGQIPMYPNLIERSAQAIDVNRQGVVVDKRIGIPKVAHDGLARDNRSRMAHKQTQDPQLVFGQLDFRALVQRARTGNIELKPIMSQHSLSLRGGAATQKRLHARNENTL